MLYAQNGATDAEISLVKVCIKIRVRREKVNPRVSDLDLDPGGYCSALFIRVRRSPPRRRRWRGEAGAGRIWRGKTRAAAAGRWRRGGATRAAGEAARCGGRRPASSGGVAPATGRGDVGGRRRGRAVGGDGLAGALIGPPGPAAAARWRCHVSRRDWQRRSVWPDRTRPAGAREF